MAQRPPSMQAGIFANDLCISFRIVLHELLDNFVFKILHDAKALAEDGASTKLMYERGVRSVNTWDSQLKDRYRAQVVAQYRQITQLYRHAYLMYVEEMYAESLGDVTVRVSIPSLSAMLYAFIKIACNNPSVYGGEYVAQMPFTGRVLFVETAIRRTLYELLVQQNNIKGISSTNPGQPVEPAVSSPSSSPMARPSRPSSRVAVVENDGVLSHELDMGQDAPKPMNMEMLSSRLSRSTGSVASQGLASPAPVSPPQVAMPSMHTSVLQQPAFSPNASPGFKFFDAPPSEKTQTVASSPKVVAVETAPVASSPKVVAPATAAAAAAAVAAPALSAFNVASPTLTGALSKTSSNRSLPPLPPGASPKPTAPANSAASSEAPPAKPEPPLPSVAAPTPASAKPSVEASTPAPAPTTAPAPTSAPPPTPAPAQTDGSGNIFSIASTKPAPTQNTSVENQPVFDVISGFTAKFPGGQAFPMPRLSARTQEDGALDSLQLLPSEQDFGGEVRRILDSATTNSITPFDSVTNIGSAARPPPQPQGRKSLFMPPH